MTTPTLRACGAWIPALKCWLISQDFVPTPNGLVRIPARPTTQTSPAPRREVAAQ